MLCFVGLQSSVVIAGASNLVGLGGLEKAFLDKRSGRLCMDPFFRAMPRVSSRRSPD